MGDFMTTEDLANVIFPNITKTVEDIEKMYPKRNMKDGAEVTRFAPSPTGYMHIGNFMMALIDYIIARNTDGIFYLRNEDTDKAREVENAVNLIMDTLDYYGINPDEYEFDGNVVGKYGPYIQSKRKEIYHVYIKHLISIGRAYPCFCTPEELNQMREKQEMTKIRTGYYGRFSKCRKLSIDEAIKRIQAGEPYVIRFKSNGDFENKIWVDDLVKGRLHLSENDIDDVIMKSENLLPTYHFAHIIDDHLMHTTVVVRGEEWLPSVTKHIQMFEAFGFDIPKYVHTPLILKKEGENTRKISKRKDPEALMKFYVEQGYPRLAVIESVMTIINSNYEQWHQSNPDKTFLDFTFDPKKMSSSGALYDLMKLEDISKDMVSKMTKDELYDESYAWALQYDKKLASLIEKNPDYYKAVLNIEREQLKPRKDIAKYSDIYNLVWYMYDDLFKDVTYEWMKINSLSDIKNILNIYMEKYYSDNDSKDEWFNKIKSLATELGYAANMKDYKKNPDNYKGNVADIATVLRVALTSKKNTPDLYEIMQLFGRDRIIARYNLIKK